MLPDILANLFVKLDRIDGRSEFEEALYKELALLDKVISSAPDIYDATLEGISSDNSSGRAAKYRNDPDFLDSIERLKNRNINIFIDGGLGGLDTDSDFCGNPDCPVRKRKGP